MPRRTSAGRPGALDEARELIALVASLSEAGDALSVEAVSSRLGVDAVRAEKLISLVATAAGAGGTQLPLVEERGEVSLVFSQGMRGRRLRLTRTETVALAAVLEELGVREDDPLRARLRDSLAEDPVDERLVARLVSGSESAHVTDAISACARAITLRQALSFLYEKPGSAARERRRAIPRELRHEDSTWYLDALDLDRQAGRTFRLDRMSAFEAQPAPEAAPECPQAAREVRLDFSDARYLDLLPWHDLLHVERGEKDNTARAVTHYYGGMWLPRMVAACGGAVTADDAEVTSLAARYAREQLSLTRGTPATS